MTKKKALKNSMSNDHIFISDPMSPQYISQITADNGVWALAESVITANVLGDTLWRGRVRVGCDLTLLAETMTCDVMLKTKTMTCDVIYTLTLRSSFSTKVHFTIHDLERHPIVIPLLEPLAYPQKKLRTFGTP
jgi:hypothetical protein